MISLIELELDRFSEQLVCMHKSDINLAVNITQSVEVLGCLLSLRCQIVFQASRLYVDVKFKHLNQTWLVANLVLVPFEKGAGHSKSPFS